MKLVVSRQELLRLIRNIQNIAPQSPPIPVLSHVLLETEGQELILTATDLTVGARCHGQARIVEKGALLIPSKRFFQLVRELTDQNLEISGTSGEMVEIRSGSSRFRLHGMERTAYPELPDFAEANRIQVPSSTLKEMLYRTVFAVSKEDQLLMLNGLLLRIVDGRLLLVATDGKRLAKTECGIESPIEGVEEYILPTKAVDEMIKLLTDEGEATLYLLPDKLALEVNHTFFVTKLLSGKYPDFQQIMETPGDTSVEIHREELMTLLRQISLFTTEESQSTRFTFQPGELILSANSADIGEGKVSMPVHYHGPKIEVAFHPQYFLDILKHSKDETVRLMVTDAYNPGIITDSLNGLFVIMPLRFADDS